ncbi:MAG TPA: hypothetical protein VN420_00705 [Candidatus Fimivivens sp.]|nr:hypothetical protein [Candidatus Fimivivens sp.]
MDKRLVGLVAIVVGAVTLTGCSNSVNESQDQEGTRDQVQSQAQESAKSGVADWVAGLSEGKRMRCEYSFGEGDKAVRTVMYMERDRYRTEVGTPAGDMVSLFDGKVMYSWTKDGKQGMRMDIECMKQLGDKAPKGEATQKEAAPERYDSPQDALESIPDIACSVTTDAVDLSVPTDVTFADQCEMLKGALGKIPAGMQDRIPDGVKGMMNGQ